MPEYRIFHATDTDWWRGKGHQGPPILINVDVSRLRSGRLRAELRELRRAPSYLPRTGGPVDEQRRDPTTLSWLSHQTSQIDQLQWKRTHPRRGLVGGHGPSDDLVCTQQGTGSGRPLTTPGRPPRRFPLSQQNNPRRWTRRGDGAVNWLASMFSPVPQGVH